MVYFVCSVAVKEQAACYVCVHRRLTNQKQQAHMESRLQELQKINTNLRSDMQKAIGKAKKASDIQLCWAHIVVHLATGFSYRCVEAEPENRRRIRIILVQCGSTELVQAGDAVIY